MNRPMIVRVFLSLFAMTLFSLSIRNVLPENWLSLPKNLSASAVQAQSTSPSNGSTIPGYLGDKIFITEDDKAAQLARQDAQSYMGDNVIIDPVLISGTENNKFALVGWMDKPGPNGEGGGGQILLKNSGAKWIVVAGGGGAMNVRNLTYLGVPIEDAQKLIDQFQKSSSLDSSLE